MKAEDTERLVGDRGLAEQGFESAMRRQELLVQHGHRIVGPGIPDRGGTVPGDRPVLAGAGTRLASVASSPTSPLNRLERIRKRTSCQAERKEMTEIAPIARSPVQLPELNIERMNQIKDETPKIAMIPSVRAVERVLLARSFLSCSCVSFRFRQLGQMDETGDLSKMR